MYGFSPLAIPTSFENTKFPSVDDRIKQLQNDQEEALAAHVPKGEWWNDGRTNSPDLN